MENDMEEGLEEEKEEEGDGYWPCPGCSMDDGDHLDGCEYYQPSTK